MNIKLLGHAFNELTKAHEHLGTGELLEELVKAAKNAAGNSVHQQSYLDNLTKTVSSLESYKEVDLFDYEVDLLNSANMTFLIPSRLAYEIANVNKGNSALLAVVNTKLAEIEEKFNSAIEKLEEFDSIFTEFKIPSFDVSAGDAFIAVHLPTSSYSSNLGTLGKRATEVNKHVNELIQFSSGEANAATLKSISEGSAVFILATSLALAYTASQILEKISVAGVNFMQSKKIAEETKIARENASEELKLKKIEVAKQQIELAEAELKESISLIADSHADPNRTNSKKGLERAIKGYIEHQIIGIRYEFLAIEYSDENEDVSDDTKAQIAAINSYTGRELSKISEDLKPLLLELARDKTEEE